MTKTKSGTKSAIKLIIALLIIAAAAYAGYTFMQVKTGAEHADEVLETMRSVIPNFGVDTGASTGQGRDPLPQLVIADKDIVGCIDIPAIDVTAPVTIKGQEEEGFATLESGSPIKGSLKIAGGRYDVFLKLSKANPGDTVSFTDIDGVRYNYRVLTQFHLKEWDEADEDLMLCYQTDDETEFVVGCKAEH